MKNKLIPAILIGAGIGAALSLIDKGTRESVLKGGKDLRYYASNPEEIKNKIQVQSNEPSKLDQIKDEILFWKETIEEIRKNNPELEESIVNAKNTLMEMREQKKS
jgi:uncharacterized coiled-coil DUF342 family protein